MNVRSITLKLLTLILVAFVLIIAGVLFTSRVQLTKIIDSSQHDIFTEKVDVIWETLKRNDVRLQKTGLVEAYQEDIQTSTLGKLQNTYYRQSKTTLKPILLDEHSAIVLHPTIPRGQLFMAGNRPFQALRDKSHGELYATTDGREMWYLYRVFEPWNWTIVYAVPLNEKYEDVQSFSSLLFFTMLSITLLVALLLSFTIAKLIRPISLLTRTAAEIAEGNLDNPVNIRSNDEIGLLARSFDSMRKAIKSQIHQLNGEVAERKKAEVELRYLEGYLADIINSMPSVIIGIDAQQQITRWNTKAEEATSIPAREALGTPLAQTVPELEEISPLITESLAHHEIKRLTKRERKEESETIYEDLTIYPLSSRGKEKAGAVIRIDDITKEHELELQVRHSQRMDAIGQLAGGVAHDFNNMLSGIFGASDLLELSLAGKEKELKYVGVIKNAAEQAAGLTTKLLAFSRKGKQLSTPVDLHSIIEDAVAILERSIDKRITIHSELGAGQCMVIGDPSQLQSGILNICVNARDALPDGGDIHISTTNVAMNENDCELDTHFTPGTYIKLTIEDNGTGIPHEVQSRIFEPFFTTKDTGKGTGLGLAAVYGMVQEHHGHIRLYSEPARGTVFHIFLPISEADAPGRLPLKGTLAYGTGTVLVVDDEDIIRATASLLLENLGYTVLLAQDGKEGVETYSSKADEIDLVILDMVMPVMDGRTAFEKIMAINPDAKVIISSGYTRNMNMTAMVSQGLAGSIAKPFNQLELSRLIDEVLAK